MKRPSTVAHLFALALTIGLTLTAGPALHAQQPASSLPPLPEGYMPRGYRPAKGQAPGMKVTDLGKSGRTFRLNFVKGDEIMSGMVDFAEKNHIKNAHFSGLGALSHGMFGWTDTERANGQKKVEVNEECEVVSFLGSISTDSQGRVTVHGHGSVALQDGSMRGGHWFEAKVGIIAEIFVTEEEAEPTPLK